MARQDDIAKTDPSEIEALIERVKRSGIEPRDAQLVERLLRLVLSMASLLEHKNASIKRLKCLIFGPGSDARINAGASAKEPASDIATEPDADLPPHANSSGSQSCAPNQKPKRSGHGRKGASAYTGARVMICRHPALKA